MNIGVLIDYSPLYARIMVIGLLAGMTLGLIMFVIGYVLFRFIGVLRNSI